MSYPLSQLLQEEVGEHLSGDVPGVNGGLAQLADGPEKADPTRKTILLESLLDFLVVGIKKF